MSFNNFGAAVKGSLTSTVILFFILVGSLLFVPKNTEEYGEHLYGVGLLSGLILPVSLCVLFIYYLMLGLRKNKSFKFALFMQLVFIIPIVIIVYSIFISHNNSSLAWRYAFYTFSYFGIAAVCGAWVWSRNKHITRR